MYVISLHMGSLTNKFSQILLLLLFGRLQLNIANFRFCQTKAQIDCQWYNKKVARAVHKLCDTISDTKNDKMTKFIQLFLFC